MCSFIYDHHLPSLLFFTFLCLISLMMTYAYLPLFHLSMYYKPCTVLCTTVSNALNTILCTAGHQSLAWT